MKKELFTVYRDELKIKGIAYLNESSGLEAKHPAIIMSHGFMANLKGFEYFAEKFCEMGYNVYTYNFCCGSDETDMELKSDGDSIDMCLESEISDLTAVYNYIILQNCVKSDEVYLWGESQGALVSGLTAARLQDKVKKLIMIFPAVCIPDHARRGTLGGAIYDPKNLPDTIETPRCMLGRAFHDEVKEMDVYSELAKFKGDVLLIQGDCDSIVVPEYQYIVKDWFDKTDEMSASCDNSDGEVNACAGTSECDLSDKATDIVGKPLKSANRLRFQMVRGMDHWTGGEHRDGLLEAIKFFIDGKREILTFRIIVTRVESLDDNDKIELSEDRKVELSETTELLVHKQDVYFTGYCESDLFTGTIVSGVDHQEYKGSECLSMRAIYKFTGVDSDGEYCEIAVCNEKRDGAWRPSIQTDSKALAWLNNADLYAVVEVGPKGPTIRVYC